MTKKPTPSTEAHDLRQLLAAVLDAITLPYSAHDYDRRILDRAGHVRAVLQSVLNPDQSEDLAWETDYLRRKLTAEQAEADERAKNRCGRCHQRFDPADTRFDGRARYRETRWCRRCIDNCHEGSAEHVCVICNAKRYSGEGR